jgi:hypothetical protein
MDWRLCVGAARKASPGEEVLQVQSMLADADRLAYTGPSRHLHGHHQAGRADERGPINTI